MRTCALHSPGAWGAPDSLVVQLCLLGFLQLALQAAWGKSMNFLASSLARSAAQSQGLPFQRAQTANFGDDHLTCLHWHKPGRGGGRGMAAST